MPRYTTATHIALQPKLAWDEDVPLIPAIIVPDHFASHTGIYNASGEELLRLPNPIGFMADIE